MNSRNIIGMNPSMVIPLLANQDLTPMLWGRHLRRALIKISEENNFYSWELPLERNIYIPGGLHTIQNSNHVKGLREFPSDAV